MTSEPAIALILVPFHARVSWFSRIYLSLVADSSSLPTLIGAMLLGLLLVGLAVFYSWRQIRTLWGLRGQSLAEEDRRYYRHQAWRRLFCCLLMLILAALMLGSFALGLEERADRLAELGEAHRLRGEKPDLTTEQRLFFNFYSSYWITILVVLFVLLCIIGLDIWAIGKYALRHHRQIQQDRREVLQEELTRYRTQRNGDR
ncbi:MAG: hypothetical protein ACK4RK_19955 [Gemmataceae bacterium]